MLLAGAVALAMSPAAGAAAATAGDLPAAAPEITGAEGTVTVLSDRTDGGDASLWWTWTAPATGTYRFYTHGSEMDTVLTVHADGAGGAPLVTNDDDGDVSTSLVTFDAEAGDVHAVEVVAASDEPGLVSLTWHAGGAEAVAPAVEPESSGLTASATTAEQLTAARIVEGSATISSTVNTGEKPQSKTWKYAGTWWAVLPNADGTWVWRHDGGSWTNVYRLSGDTTLRADVKVYEGIVHVLLHGGSSKLVSLQYDSANRTYQPWGRRTSATPLDMAGSETATIDIDSTGRMWLAYDTSSAVRVQYSQAPYSTFSGPVTLETGIDDDDIAVVTAMSGGVGVMWSDQKRDHFGFRFHPNSSAPDSWAAPEYPGSAYAASNGAGFADDHINLAAASDGTLYAVVKTSYDDSAHPDLGLLVRRPGGAWDRFYEVSGNGTRGVVQLNEADKTLHVVYTNAINFDDIRVRESSTSSISFGSAETVFSGSFNNPTSTKDRWTGDLMVLAADAGNEVHTALVSSSAPAPQEPPPTEPTDPPTDPADPQEPPPPAPADYGFFLTNGWTSTADHHFVYGRFSDQVLIGDWDDDGQDTITVRRGAGYYVNNTLGGGSADEVVIYGTATDTVLVGDWDGDGVDTLAVRRGNAYHIRNDLASGPADKVVNYGRATDTVLVGDWDGDGEDTLGVRRGNTYYLKNSISGGTADRVVTYGRATDVVLTGDWDGDGDDTLGVRRGSTYYIKNSISGGTADRVVTYGRATDEVYVGDWDADGDDTLGLRRQP
ncbi:hypothetical protein [Georgenia daeguensis]|uniref:hypothetical protein n=1 Tax=Georgenia daeguensis TaxID=908355 RepID=UPI0031E67B43